MEAFVTCTNPIAGFELQQFVISTFVFVFVLIDVPKSE